VDEKCPALRKAFGSPGLYLFGGETGVPLYLGMTRGPLWSRLRRRYVCGHRSQCQLAVDYNRQLIEQGVAGLLREVRQ
jgi:hypothetical protein